MSAATHQRRSLWSIQSSSNHSKKQKPRRVSVLALTVWLNPAAVSCLTTSPSAALVALASQLVGSRVGAALRSWSRRGSPTRKEEIEDEDSRRDVQPTSVVGVSSIGTCRSWCARKQVVQESYPIGDVDSVDPIHVAADELRRRFLAAADKILLRIRDDDVIDRTPVGRRKISGLEGSIAEAHRNRGLWPTIVFQDDPDSARFSQLFRNSAGNFPLAYASSRKELS